MKITIETNPLIWFKREQPSTLPVTDGILVADADQAVDAEEA
jgi:hypothetical protein